MSLIRGVLLAGKFRTQHALNGMSPDDQRNTLIVEMATRTNQSGGHYQAMDNATLAGVSAVLVFIRDGQIRDDEAIKNMSDDDLRNTLIVELAAQTGLSGPVLQGMSNTDLVYLGLGKSGSFIRGVLLAGKFRTQHELNGMSPDDQRNTLIVEMATRTNQSGGHYQAMDDATLAGAGAVLVFIRDGQIRDDEAIKNMSDDDLRNTLIVELAAQTGLTGPVLQGMSNIDLVSLGLGIGAREIVPRNIAWVEDMPPKLTPEDLASIAASRFSHIIVCFFHLDAGPKLVYNGPNIDPYGDNFASLWRDYYHMSWTGNHKTMMISVGGWGSGTWANAEGKEEEGARVIADFVLRFHFAGVDLNFEGDWNYRTDPRWLAVVAKLAVNLRGLLADKIVTIAPMQDNVILQVQAINAEAAKIGKHWRDILSWINAQFYVFRAGRPDPTPDPSQAYQKLLGEAGIWADKLVLGVPLESQQSLAAKFNLEERRTATDAAQSLRQQLPFAGVFVWRWEDTRYPPDLEWAQAMESALGR